jgi:DNA-directed RNA polymerase specialized sigma24 family protein
MAHETDSWVSDAIEAHGAMLERSIRAMVHDPDEAADIWQEVMVRLMTAARAGTPPASPGAWMDRGAPNLDVSRARHRAVATRVADRLVDRRVQPGIDEVVVDRERSAAVRTWLDDAPNADRTAIVLAANGHPIRDIAARIGRTELATRALLCRARARGRRRLLAAELV